jgi:hypothetical protein
MLLLSLQNAFAVMMEKGKTKVKTLLNGYSQSSKTDNSIDESVKIFEPQIFVKHQITADTEINASFVLDAVTSESASLLDGNTGASGATSGSGGWRRRRGQTGTSGTTGTSGAINPGEQAQVRVAPNLGIKREVEKTSYGANLGFSSEFGYKSRNASADIQRSFAEDNFNIGLGIQYYSDTANLLQDINTGTTKDFDRDVYALNLGISQIITTKDIIEFGATYAYSKGRLESTAGTVNVDGTAKVEVLPGERKRNAFSTKWVHSLGDDVALNLSYRNYFDDWGARAHSIRGAYLVALRDERDFLEFALRYHSQGLVDYYKDIFSTTEQYMTSDSDLSKFHSFEPSIMYSRHLGQLKDFSSNFQNTEWGNSLTYSKRNTGLNYIYLQTSLTVYF